MSVFLENFLCIGYNGNSEIVDSERKKFMRRHFLFRFSCLCLLTGMLANSFPVFGEDMSEAVIEETSASSVSSENSVESKTLSSSIKSYSMLFNMTVDVMALPGGNEDGGTHMKVDFDNCVFDNIVDRKNGILSEGHISGNMLLETDDVNFDGPLETYVFTEDDNVVSYSSVDEAVWEKTSRPLSSAFLKPVDFDKCLSEVTYSASGASWKQEDTEVLDGVPVKVYSMTADSDMILSSISYMTGGLCSDLLDLLSTEIKGLRFPVSTVYLYKDAATGYPVKLYMMCNQFNDLQYEENGIEYVYNDFIFDVMFDRYNMIRQQDVSVPAVVIDSAIDDGKALYGYMVSSGLQAGITLVDDNLLLLRDKSGITLEEGWFIESEDKKYRLGFSSFDDLTEVGVNKEKYRLEVSKSDFSSDLYSFAYLMTGLNAKDSAMTDQSLTNEFYTEAQDAGRVANIEVTGLKSYTWDGHIVYYYYYEYTKPDNGFVQQVYTYYVELDSNNYVRIEVQSQTDLGESVALSESIAKNVLEHYLVVGVQ